MSRELKNPEKLRELIIAAFPAETYSGKVTPAEGAFTPELDDEEVLFNGLIGRKWTEIDRKLLEAQPDGYALLTDKAYKAFLAAWLMYALENMQGKNEVREFVVYAFSNTAQQLRALNQEQRAAVRSLLESFGEHEPDSSLRKLVGEALENIAMLERNLVAFP